MSLKIHGVVQDSADYQHVTISTADEEVSWTTDSSFQRVSAAL